MFQVYYVGPVMGALLGTYTYQFLFAMPKDPSRGKHLPCPMELKPIDSGELINNKIESA